MVVGKSDVDRLTTYSVVLGRALGCGTKTGEETALLAVLFRVVLPVAVAILPTFTFDRYLVDYSHRFAPLPRALTHVDHVVVEHAITAIFFLSGGRVADIMLIASGLEFVLIGCAQFEDQFHIPRLRVWGGESTFEELLGWRTAPVGAMTRYRITRAASTDLGHILDLPGMDFTAGPTALRQFEAPSLPLIPPVTAVSADQ